MNNSEIPEWQYPLYKDSDKTAYSVLERLGKPGKYPELIGSKNEINDFLKLLIISQKMKDYRMFRDNVITALEKEEIDISKILKKNQNIEIVRGINDWAIFIQDRRICELTDQLHDSRILFEGTNDEIIEFTVRFLLSQLLQDWRGPLMAVILNCLKDKKIKIYKINKLLETWDYTNIFHK